MTIKFKPKGVCSTEIELSIENGIITGVRFTRGCHGNAQGVAKLAVGRPAAEVAELLKGIDCGGKGTSCPDQLACAILSTTA